MSKALGKEINEFYKRHVEKFYEVNGKYPNNIRVAKKLKTGAGFQTYCAEKGIKVSYV